MSMMEDEHHSSHKPQSAFEFTKRKRWADTIVTELLDIAILVFSHTGNILHCDAAVDDVIGYSEDDLLGKNVAGILHEQDVSVFLEAFNDSISVHSDLTSYVRIKPKHAASQKRCRLYEVRASPYYAPNNTDCVCVFAMVAPYPTFNSKDLDSFLPLKLENELLHDRLAELKRGDGHDTDESVSSDDRQQTPQSTSSYPDVMMRDHQTHIHGMGYHNRLSPDYTAQLQLPVAKPKPRSPPHRRESAKAKAANLRGAVQNAAAADVTEPNSLKRKRRSEASDGRVCTACGRNNSPEWRKGPQGPKTLCNACGLRWAKKAKRSHEPVEAV